MSKSLQEVSELLDLSAAMRQIEKEIQPLLETIAREKFPDQPAEETLEKAFADAANGMLSDDATYKERLDRMADDMGTDNFNAIRANPDFQSIYEKWGKDFNKRQFDIMVGRIVEWSGDRITPEKVKLLLKVVVQAQKLAGQE